MSAQGALVGARANYYPYKQLTSLHFAAAYNPNADVIRALVDKGADIDAPDYDFDFDNQLTPLHFAAWCKGVFCQ